MRPRADVAHGRLRRFLHHVAQFAGGGELAAAFHDGRFGGQDLPAHLGPGQARGRADLVLLVRLQIAELLRAKIVR